MGNIKARERRDEAHLGASSQATKSALKDATRAACDFGSTSLTSSIKVRNIATPNPYYTNIEIPCSKTARESDASNASNASNASDEESIFGYNQEEAISDKGGRGTEEGKEDDSDNDANSTVMPTSTNCLPMGSFVDTPMPEPFIDNNNMTQSTTCPPTDSRNAGTSDTEPFFPVLEMTHVGRKRKCRDMSGLSLCLCGVSVQPDDVGSIRCQRTGCETVWVSDPFFYWNLAESIYVVSSTMCWVC